MTYHLGCVIDHIHLSVSDLEASRRFDRAVCQALGMRHVFKDASDHFTIAEIDVDAATDYVSRIYLAFQATSREDFLSSQD